MSNVEYEFFVEEEFLRAVPSCSLSDMDSDFMRNLDLARKIAGVPFKINSAYRSPSYEKSKGRSGKSMHCCGCAVDIKCVDSGNRYKILQALIAVGFNGIGIDNTFIHVDNRRLPLIWLY